ncbi:hypothetical protein D6764_04635 [Candidatus Woesearchaeota archaeon]|nr:MAG: hypothetical protein D6764_04635 [Candidatus Woesearchaeota archaeon]
MEEAMFRMTGVFLIVLLGFILSRVGSSLLIRIHRKRDPSSIEEPPSARFYTYAIMTTAVVLSLIVLRFDVYSLIIDALSRQLPLLLTGVLLLILVVIIVRFLIFFVELFLRRSGLREMLEEQGRGGVLNAFLSVVRFVLYVSLILVSLRILGFGISSALSTLGWFVLPVFVFFLALLFVALKNFAENLAYGLYVNSASLLKRGEIIKIRELEGEIKDVRSQGVLLETSDGYSVFILYRQLFKNFVHFKKVAEHLDTLEKIKEKFVAQKPSYCGPASLSAVLKIFGYDVPQEKIGAMAKTEVGKGTHPNELIRVARKLTNDDVIGVWIDVDKIYSLRDELKAWLHEGAIPILDFKKSALFPDAKTAHYVVCLAVQGDDLLIMDPNVSRGGIYFVDYRKMQQGMNTYSELIGGKRGYLVFAKRGTEAYYRIENGLTYADADLYTRLNSKLRKELESIVRKALRVESVLPKQVKKLIDDFQKEEKKREKVARVWKPNIPSSASGSKSRNSRTKTGPGKK